MPVPFCALNHPLHKKARKKNRVNDDFCCCCCCCCYFYNTYGTSVLSNKVSGEPVQQKRHYYYNTAFETSFTNTVVYILCIYTTACTSNLGILRLICSAFTKYDGEINPSIQTLKEPSTILSIIHGLVFIQYLLSWSGSRWNQSLSRENLA